MRSDGAGVWVVSLLGGVCSRSTDNGATWSELPQALGSGIALGVMFDIATDRNGVWVAVGGTNSLGTVIAMRSTDNGATWSAINPNTGQSSGYLYSVDTDRNGVWVITQRDGWASRSIDNGLTWTTLPRGLNSGFNDNSSLSKVRTDRAGNWCALAFSDLGSARSTDNGATWSALTLPGLTTDIRSLCADGAGNFVAGGTALGNSYRSNDAGAIWTQFALSIYGPDMSALDCDEFGNVVAGFSNGGVALS
jgi:hypothetical protein